MSDVALELRLPETAFQLLQKRAEEEHKSVPQFLVEITLDYLDREARLAIGRAMLRKLPQQGAEKSDRAPDDLADRHNEYLATILT